MTGLREISQSVSFTIHPSSHCNETTRSAVPAYKNKAHFDSQQIQPDSPDVDQHIAGTHNISPATTRPVTRDSAWRHLIILGVIVFGGMIVGRAAELIAATRGTESSSIWDFLAHNLALLVVGFGVAIYGCIINRQLHHRLRIQEELGPYILKELLGSGGMGDVYLAEHRLLKRLCAVKLIRRDRAESTQLIQCFEREVKATARLTHWNTVQVYDYGRTASGIFY